jgi:hypothetical protein
MKTGILILCLSLFGLAMARLSVLAGQPQLNPDCEQSGSCFTKTPTPTNTKISAITSTPTATATSTQTPTMTATETPTSTSTETPTVTSTETPTMTSTSTETTTPTATSTATLPPSLTYRVFIPQYYPFYCPEGGEACYPVILRGKK